MRDERERKQRRHQTEQKTLVTAVVMLLLLFLVSGGIAYAKYYAESYQKGIAIASGIYFTANHAFEADENDDIKNVIESVVSEIRNAQGYSFEFEVRNYENNILFNESAVVIPYTVSFWLESIPEGASYAVTYEEETVELTANTPLVPTFTGHSIAGGRAMANRYTVSVEISDESVYTPVPVYVEVKTEAGAAISTVLRGKMILNGAQSSNKFIESQQFVVSNESATDDEKFVELEKKSGLSYEIRTVGEVASGVATEEVKLAWNSNVFEIDLFDDTYIAWQERTQNVKPLTETRDGETWYYITLEVMPYSAQTVNFFRGEQYGDGEHPIDSINDMQQYIEAELPTSNEVIGE